MTVLTLVMLCVLGFGMLQVMVVGLPVSQTTKKIEVETHNSEQGYDAASSLEYERYLREVVEALESDAEFRKKLEKAPEADVRNGKIAQELEYVSHHVRTKLDEIKRRELDRLRNFANKEYELLNDIDREHLKVPQHLDHDNQESFEIADLQKLIEKTSEDLAEADRKRRAEFKEYEMQKEFEREMTANEMNEEQRKKFLNEKVKLQHNKHEKIHYPGNKAQLEEVWEKSDHMDKKDFDPATFFMIHDLDSNGFWDEAEVKALFIKELDKVYQSGYEQYDIRERAEEMERMREHAFKQMDTNKDALIAYHEFLAQTKNEDFKRDPAWQTVDEQPQYTHEEYLEFERRRKEEVQRMIAQGLLPPHPNMPQGYYPSDGQVAYQHQSADYPQHAQVTHTGQQMPYHGAQQLYQQNSPPHGQQQQQPVYLHPNQVYQHIPGDQHGISGNMPPQSQPIYHQQQQQPLKQQPDFVNKNQLPNQDSTQIDGNRNRGPSTLNVNPPQLDTEKQQQHNQQKQSRESFKQQPIQPQVDIPLKH